MTLVVDANVAIKWFVPQTDRAKALQVQGYAGNLIAPSLIVAEVASALWQSAKSGVLTHDQARGCIGVVLQSLSSVVPDENLIDAALTMASAIDHSPYDCVYLALAEQTGARRVTADQAFFAKLFAARRTKNVVLLHQWSP